MAKYSKYSPMWYAAQAGLIHTTTHNHGHKFTTKDGEVIWEGGHQHNNAHATALEVLSAYYDNHRSNHHED